MIIVVRSVTIVVGSVTAFITFTAQHVVALWIVGYIKARWFPLQLYTTSTLNKKEDVTRYVAIYSAVA